MGSISDLNLRASVILLILFAIAFSWLSPEVGGPNERTRLYLTEALFERGSIMVDEEVEEHGMLFDIAARDGHHYTDKAPGMSILALGTYPAFRVFEDDPTIEQSAQFARNGVMLPLSAIAIAAFFMLLTLLKVPVWTQVVVTIALWLATTLTHYAGAFYGHAGVAYFAVFALLFMQLAKGPSRLSAQLGLHSETLPEEREVSSPRRHLYVLLSGLCCGITFAIEYQAAVLCVSLGVAMLLDKDLRKPTLLLSAAVGGLIPALFVLGYNSAAFGGPLETSYQHLVHGVSVELHSEGFAGLTKPSAEAIFGVVFSASRGVLASSPILALAVLGFTELRDRSSFVAWFCLLGSITYFLTIISTPVWMGGWSYGTRLLVPIYPLLGVMVATGIYRLRHSSVVQGILVATLVGGVFLNQLVFSAFPEIPHFIEAPLRTLALPLLQTGSASPNLFSAYAGMSAATATWLWVAAATSVAIFVGVKHAKEVHDRRKFWAVAILIVAIMMTYNATYPEFDTAGVERFVAEHQNMRALPNK